MASKKVTFDLMNLGVPIHSDPYEVDMESWPTKNSIRPKSMLSEKLLREKLLAEAKYTIPEFFVRDPSSSDDSTDDYEFPETLSERVRALSFARRRKLLYTEFASVPLARRLIREEFTSEASSLKSGDSDFLMQEPEECPPCKDGTDDSVTNFQLSRSSTQSQGSEESGPREGAEPGFDPKHHCYKKLTGLPSFVDDVAELSTLAFEITPDKLNDPNMPTEAVSAIAAVSKDLQESLQKPSVVMDDDEQSDLDHEIPLPPLIPRKSQNKPGFRSI